MKPTERTNRKKNNLDENDDDGDFSSGSGDEWTPDSEENTNSSRNSEENQSPLQNDNDVVAAPEDMPFTNTAGFSLKIVKNYKSSKHPVWRLFGYLMTKGKTMNRVKDRFFCKKCFEKQKFKR